MSIEVPEHVRAWCERAAMDVVTVEKAAFMRGDLQHYDKMVEEHAEQRAALRDLEECARDLTTMRGDDCASGRFPLEDRFTDAINRARAVLGLPKWNEYDS